MIRISKNLTILLLTLGLVSVSCAAGFSPGIESLGGNPKVEAIGNTIGMSLEELDENLGTPVGSDTCQVPFKANGQDAMAQGKSFLWTHEFVDMANRQARITGIVVCTLEGVVVAEHREWLYKANDLVQTGQTNTIDRPRVQATMDGLLKNHPGTYKIERESHEKKFEI